MYMSVPVKSCLLKGSLLIFVLKSLPAPFDVATVKCHAAWGKLAYIVFGVGGVPGCCPLRESFAISSI
jgi:hypothetical protein